MLEYIDPRNIYKKAPENKINDQEREILRQLAAKVTEYASDEKQAKKRELWYAHNSLKRIRPMVIAFPEGAWLEILPWNEMVCKDAFYRAYEWTMRRLCYRYEYFDDDYVIEPVIEVPLVYEITPFIQGCKTLLHTSMEGDGQGVHQDVILLNEEEDIEKLSKPKFKFDKEATDRKVCLIKDIIGDLIEVRPYG